jgi:hypothetical protein
MFKFSPTCLNGIGRVRTSRGQEVNLIAESNLDGVYVPSSVERIRKQVADKPVAASRAEHWKARWR